MSKFRCLSLWTLPVTPFLLLILPPFCIRYWYFRLQWKWGSPRFEKKIRKRGCTTDKKESGLLPIKGACFKFFFIRSYMKSAKNGSDTLCWVVHDAFLLHVLCNPEYHRTYAFNFNIRWREMVMQSRRIKPHCLSQVEYVLELVQAKVENHQRSVQSGHQRSVPKIQGQLYESW